MAVGDIPDFVRRLRAALPRRWFPDDAPVLVGMLTGFAAVWANLYALLQYVVQQSRLATVSGVFLDMVATDYFGTRIVRNAGEPDTHFRRRILAEILRPRATRAAVDQALFDLTGQHPIIFEPANATDTGGYNIGGVGYNVAGGWGSILLPFQAFITAFRPAGGGIASVSGYGNIAQGIASTGGLGGYGVGAIEWADLEQITGAITDADIYATVAAAMPIATIGWTRGLAAGDQSAPILSRPAAAFSRSVSTAQTTLALIAGALLTGLGAASSRGRLTVAAAGSGILSATGRSMARGRAATPTGAQPLAALGVSRATSTSFYVTGVTALAMTARGISSTRGKITTAATALTLALGRSATKGRALSAVAGTTALLARGRSATTGSLAQATIMQGAPTAPSNVTATNATPNSLIITWTASQGS